jgi:glucose-6-phosphate-specific signal transduction histidine kinase
VYLLFSGLTYKSLHDVLIFLGYFGTFFAGLLYPYALTSAAGTGILLVLAKEQNIILAGVIAGIGALISDSILFLFVRHSFSDEVQKLSKKTVIQTVYRWIPDSIRVYLLVIFAGILIASPLPTEIGIILLASIKNMSVKKFVTLLFVLHASAIFVILLIGSTI